MTTASSIAMIPPDPSPGDALAPATLLQLLWLASPGLPVGGFSYSEGLEAAVEDGQVHDEASTAAWLEDQMALGLARSELPVLAASLGAWAAEPVDDATLNELNAWHLASRETAEFRLQALQMGRSMRDWLRTQAPDEPRLVLLQGLAPGPAWPVAFALALARAGAPARTGALAFGFAWAEAAVQAAVRAVPLGQSAGQRILARLAAALPGAVDGALARGPGARQSLMPGLALLSSRHETQYSRLFRS